MRWTTQSPPLKTCLASAVLLTLAACGGGGGSDNGDGNPGTPPTVRVQGAVERPGNYGETELNALSTKLNQDTVTLADGSTRTFLGQVAMSVLRNAGIGDGSGRYVLATGNDGYRVAYSVGEFDPGRSNKFATLQYKEIVNSVQGPIVGAEGPFRLMVPGDRNAGRSVSNLARLEMRPVTSAALATGGGVAGAFTVSGAVSKPATFDLAALQALPASTLSFNGNTYTGVSLWTLLNSTTGLKTETAQRNPTLAMVAVATGSNGRKELVSLGEIDPAYANLGALVAYAINGQALGADGVAQLVLPYQIDHTRVISNLTNIEVQTTAP